MSRGQYRKIGKTFCSGKCELMFGYWSEPLNETTKVLKKRTRREGKKICEKY